MRPRDLADDLMTLRGVYRDDNDYMAALVASLKEIRRAFRDRENYGGVKGELRHDLTGVRRNKFPPENQHDAVLRLVIRPYRDGIQILALRHRHDPPDMYRLAAQRLTQILREE